MAAADSKLSGEALKIFGHADAELRTDVFAVQRNLGKTGVLIECNRLGLARARFEQKTRGAEAASFAFESVDDSSSHAAVACTRVDVHPLDLGNSRFNASHSTAANWLAAHVRDQKSAAAIDDLLRIQAEEIRAFFGIAVFYLCLEREYLCLRVGGGDLFGGFSREKKKGCIGGGG